MTVTHPAGVLWVTGSGDVGHLGAPSMVTVGAGIFWRATVDTVGDCSWARPTEEHGRSSVVSVSTMVRTVSMIRPTPGSAGCTAGPGGG